MVAHGGGRGCRLLDTGQVRTLQESLPNWVSAEWSPFRKIVSEDKALQKNVLFSWLRFDLHLLCSARICFIPQGLRRHNSSDKLPSLQSPPSEDYGDTGNLASLISKHRYPL